MDYTAVGNIVASTGSSNLIRGALYIGFHYHEALILLVLVNMVIFAAFHVFLRIFHKTLRGNRVLTRIENIQGSIRSREGYGFLGFMTIFVVFAPIGLYAATVFGWLSGMDTKKTILAVILGSSIVGLLVLVDVLGLVGASKYLVSGLF